MLRAPLMNRSGSPSILPTLAPGTTSKPARRRHRNRSTAVCFRWLLLLGSVALLGGLGTTIYRFSTSRSSPFSNTLDQQQQQQQNVDKTQQRPVAPKTVATTGNANKVTAGDVVNGGGASSKDANSLYDANFIVSDIHGQDYALSQLQGKVTVVVNVASQCGYTKSNYEALSKTYEKYNAHGLEIIAFPCSAFGNQEPWENSKIESFVKESYNVTFPIMSKVEDVNKDAVFDWLRQHTPEGEGAGTAKIDWNFNKFLVGKDGHVVKRYPSAIDASALEHDIYALLL